MLKWHCKPYRWLIDDCLQVYPTMRSAFVDIIKSRGVKGLYNGLTPTLVEIVPYAGLQFGTYDMFKRWMMVSAWEYIFSVWYSLKKICVFFCCCCFWWQSGHLTFHQDWNRYILSSKTPIDVDTNLSSFQLFVCGLGAGTSAKLVCHPLDVVKKRFQVS